MGPRYPAGPRPGVRMPQLGNEFNGVSSVRSNNGYLYLLSSTGIEGLLIGRGENLKTGLLVSPPL